jgi:hypothetical protein
MNTPVITQINKTTDCTGNLPYTDIHSLIKQLSDPDGFAHQQAREVLSCLGKPVVPELINTLSNANSKLRW